MGGKKRKKRRKDGSVKQWIGTSKIKCDAIDRLTVTCAPWVSAFLFQLCRKNRVDEVKKYLGKCMSHGIRFIAESTGREILFASRHYDTEHLHFNFHSTCITEGNLKQGDVHLRTLESKKAEIDAQIEKLKNQLTVTEKVEESVALPRPRVLGR